MPKSAKPIKSLSSEPVEKRHPALPLLRPAMTNETDGLRDRQIRSTAVDLLEKPGHVLA